jgi:hypothetical protein
MARINGYAVTGNELQAMVNEHILLQKGSIPATNRCLTNAEVYDGAHVLLGNPPDGIPLENLGGGIFGPSPNWLVNFTNINPVGSQSVLFEMNQIASPYLNVDLGGYVNGIALRLDPANNLDFLFFGGPQYSPNMKQYVDVGNILAIQANFGRNDQESPGNWGWNGGGYGVLEIYQNGVLVSTQTTGWRPAATSANASSLTYTITVQPGVDYYVKAYAVLGVNDIINGCNSQSTMYAGPYPDIAEQDFYVGDGPAMFQLFSLYARKYYSPNTYPANNDSYFINGAENDWWFGHVTVGNSDLVLANSGESYTTADSIPDLTPTTPFASLSGWSFIPPGENSIKIKVYAGSPDTVWEIKSYIGCSIPGNVMNLHWSPDTPSNSCNENYSYYFFDGVETEISGFTGYKQYFVIGGFQVGGRISAYPSRTNTITNNAVGTNGMRGYVFPNYASSVASISSGVVYTTPSTPFVSPGYYSNGSNWALVGDSGASGYYDGTIIEVGTCMSNLLYEFILGTSYQYEQRCDNFNEQDYYYSYDSSISVGTQLRDVFGNPLTLFVNPGDYLYLKDPSLSTVYYVNQSGVVEYAELCNAYPPSGTFLSSYCSGTNLVYRYANGSGGYYDQVYRYDAEECGGSGGPGGPIGPEEIM